MRDIVLRRASHVPCRTLSVARQTSEAMDFALRTTWAGRRATRDGVLRRTAYDARRMACDCLPNNRRRLAGEGARATPTESPASDPAPPAPSASRPHGL